MPWLKCYLSFLQLAAEKKTSFLVGISNKYSALLILSALHDVIFVMFPCTSSAKTFIYENLLGFLENWESFQHLHLCHHLWYHYPPLKTNPQQTYQARKEEENSVHNHKKNYQMLRDSLLAFLCFIKQIRHHLKKTDYWMWISPHFQRGSSPIAKNGHEPLYSYRQHFFLILQRRI